MSQIITKLFSSKPPYREIIIYTVPTILLLILFVMGFKLEGAQQFSMLAQSFWHGHLYFLKSIGGMGEDPLLYHGRVFWGEGPFPAIFLMPFVGVASLFHVFFEQGYIKWALMLGIIFFIYKIARGLAYNIEDSWLLVLAFTLGSVFIGVAGVSSSWFFAQILCIFLIFWGLYEYIGRKRWWLLGIISGFVLLTRITAAPLVIFFGLELLRTVKNGNQRYKKLFQLGLPVIIAVLLIFLYNFLRFHDPFNGGFAYQLEFPNTAAARSLGLFSLIHIPTNFYSAVLRAPTPILRSSASWTLKFPFIQNNPYGMSIFFTSPYFLYLFTLKWSAFTARDKNLMLMILVGCLLVFSYYGVGIQQYGYRYSLDFLPELFLLFMIKYRSNHGRITLGMKSLILGCCLVNFYLMWQFILSPVG